MMNKRFLLTWLLGFIGLFGFNAIFHLLIAGKTFDSHLAHLAPMIHPMKEGNPVPVAILDFLLAFTMVYFISKLIQLKPTIQTGIIAGALINFTTSQVFNLANSGLFHWSKFITALDISWHTLLGGFIGGFTAWLLLKVFKN